MNLPELKMRKERSYWALLSIDLVENDEATTHNFAQTKTLTDAYEVFRVFVMPHLRRNGHDVAELGDINLDLFFTNIKTKIPAFQRSKLCLQ